MNHKIKRRLIALTLCFCTAMVWAQEEAHPNVPGNTHHLFVGINAGDANNYLYNSNDHYRPYTETSSAHGFTISVPVRYQIFTWLGVQVEPTFIQKNYSNYRTAAYTTDVIPIDYKRLYSDWTNSFVDFPILANLSVGLPRHPELRAFINAGGWLGVWAESRIKGSQRTTSGDPGGYYGSTDFYQYNSYDEKVEFDNRKDNRFDAGLIIGGGIQYSFKALTFNMEVRYYGSLTDLQKPYMKEQLPMMNDTIVVQAGVSFNSALFDLFSRGGK
ncbi:hypothetical protein AGMMS49546_10700 [Spirochaetia bacterium]|nr:hypothetical protein AGMMS49546_10700 [Spirochaetia bacterium]